MPKFNFNILSGASLKKAYWLELIGSPSAFTLESRIFHSISIGLILLAGVYIPYNLYAGLYVASFSAWVLALFFSYQYYNSRFRAKPHNSTLFGIAGVLIFGVNYFSNSGINGSTDLIWPAYLLLLFAISPYRQHLSWLILYIICFLLLHTLEHYHPELVKYPFIAGKGRFIDRITAFPIPVVTIYIVIRYIRRSYDKEREAAEEKAIAVEKGDMEKTKLMSIISHDLRTPLMNIQNSLQLMTENDLSITERASLEGALLKSTNSAVEMLSNLLHWSKSQMQGAHVQLQELNLADTLYGTLEMEKLHAVKKHIRLSHRIPAQLNLLADQNMLQLVVRNLISNAIKFTPNGGLIHIEAEAVSGTCRITVSDSGQGIPVEQQEHIFSIKAEPSFGTNNERGVGLGLVLCKEFTERQGGHIAFNSNPGEGSQFSIFLPLVGIYPKMPSAESGNAVAQA